MKRQTNGEPGAILDQWYDALAALWSNDTDERFEEAQRKLDRITPKARKYLKGLTQRQRDKLLATWPAVLNKKIGLTGQDIHFIEKPDWLTLHRRAKAA